jgi:hypothetical protein
MNFMIAAMSSKDVAGRDPGDFQPPPSTPASPSQKVDTPDTAPATEETR